MYYVNYKIYRLCCKKSYCLFKRKKIIIFSKMAYTFRIYLKNFNNI